MLTYWLNGIYEQRLGFFMPEGKNLGKEPLEYFQDLICEARAEFIGPSGDDNEYFKFIKMPWVINSFLVKLELREFDYNDHYYDAWSDATLEALYLVALDFYEQLFCSQTSEKGSSSN